MCWRWSQRHRCSPWIWDRTASYLLSDLPLLAVLARSETLNLMPWNHDTSYNNIENGHLMSYMDQMNGRPKFLTDQELDNVVRIQISELAWPYLSENGCEQVWRYRLDHNKGIVVIELEPVCSSQYGNIKCRCPRLCLHLNSRRMQSMPPCTKSRNTLPQGLPKLTSSLLRVGIYL